MRLLRLVLAAVALIRGPESERGVVLAVVVHPGIPVEDVSLAELRRLFLGDRQFWTSGLRVTLLVPPPRSRERALLLSRVYEKTEAQYRHYWIAKIFRTEATAAPKVIPSAGLAGSLVREIEGSLAVVDAEQVPAGVKVLTVNGKAAGDDGYPLR
jgi:hypothetical protein